MRTALLERGRTLATGVILPTAAVVLWHFASKTGSTVVPTVGEVLDVLIHPLRSPPNIDSPSLLSNVAISVFRVLIGYVAAIATAVPLGLAVGHSERVRRAVMPTVELLRPVCPIAWLPLAIIVFGFASIGSLLWGEDVWRHGFLGQVQLAMVVIIWWGAFFPILLSSVHGVEVVRTLYVEEARILGANRRQVFFHVVLPSALPTVLTGMRVGLGIAWMVIIAAEIFPGTRSGLGYMITTSHQVAQYEYAFACIIVIGLIGLLLNVFLGAAASRLGHWQKAER